METTCISISNNLLRISKYSFTATWEPFIIRGMNDMQEIISTLRETGWTIQAIADELGVHRESINDWTSGRYYPSHSKLVLGGLTALLKRRPPKLKRYPGTHHLQRKKAERERNAEG